jgi:hypothetical protein
MFVRKLFPEQRHKVHPAAGIGVELSGLGIDERLDHRAALVDSRSGSRMVSSRSSATILSRELAERCHVPVAPIRAAATMGCGVDHCRLWISLFLSGAFAAAFVTGLAGVAFGTVAAAAWLYFLAPAQVAPLIVDRTDRTGRLGLEAASGDPARAHLANATRDQLNTVDDGRGRSGAKVCFSVVSGHIRDGHDPTQLTLAV